MKMTYLTKNIARLCVCAAVIMTATSVMAYKTEKYSQARTAFEHKYGVTLLPVPESMADARLRFIREYQVKTKPRDWKAWRKQKDELSTQQFEKGLELQADKLFEKDAYSKADFEQRMLADFDARAAKMQTASDKQTQFRFNAIDYDKDGKMDIGEFQRTGLKSFDRYDASGDGVITAEDKTLFEADQKLVNKNSRQRIKGLIYLPSQHSISGFLTRYQQNGEKITQASYLAHREKHFNKTDANANGTLDPSEYQNEFNGRLGKAKSAARRRYQAYVSAMTSQVDANQDGAVTKAEYMTYLTRVFQAFDSNTDGQVDTSDS